MPNSSKWDCSLKLKGVTLEGLGMAKVGEYIVAFADLLGNEARPVLAGVVRGSVVLRATCRNELPSTRRHLQAALQNQSKPILQIASLLSRDDARGAEVRDRTGARIIELPVAKRVDSVPEVIVPDDGEIDGVVVGIEGKDETAHIRLLDQATNEVTSIKVRDMDLARRAAALFRSGVVRVKVHGTWRLEIGGRWKPHSIYADSLQELDARPVSEVAREMQDLNGLGWNELGREGIEALLADMRSAS